MSDLKQDTTQLGFEIENEQFRTEVATMDRKGTRKWVYAKKPSGKYTNYRSIVSSILLILLVALPFIKLPNGNPVFKFDVFNTNFILFGYPFFTTDFFLLAFGMIVSVVFVILFTTIYGRLFCGWVCPQTIFMESVFRRIEYWIEGDRSKQIRLDKQDWNEEKILKRGGKWTVFYIISFFFSNILFSYIIGIDELIKIYSEGPSEHAGKFLGLFIFSVLFYFVFAWFREQVCTLVCPYGRLQGVLIDKKTIQVSYDFPRGESTNGRSKFRKGEDRVAAGKGDCIDCGQCIAVCPTGIDIRNGSQLECVNCTACMDACDTIMTKINLPTGLIRHASEENIEQGKPFKLSARLIAFTFVLVAMISAMTAFTLNRSDVEVKFLQVPGKDYVVEGDYIINTMQYSLMNKTNKTYKMVVNVNGFKGGKTILLVEPNQYIEINEGELKQGLIDIKIPKSELKSYKVPVILELKDLKGKTIDHYTISFMAPF
ncbi:cytochrome c oxidase accessory protein CcoG [Empedobacter stercoris]|uniref:cytochrome c oxidase accessory protein CcoG n=1 Tax=Empedobacter stercoris TaxID=1628248 RepID=UPI0016628938|nr:cytochrome c oxidase accessory protein CcoG [Empedobacter stercoris]MCA4810367.1 cytochrome c oxidase accessory protein CcoG [Empedobacter stercoris]QNT13565.1 cytochrome c oxidase accessory protein CcoG [Empedobacter stercoris]